MYAEDGIRGDVRVINVEPDENVNDKSEFFPEEIVNAAGDVAISGAGTKIVNGWIVITIPKSEKITKPEFTQSQNAVHDEATEDADNYYYAYKFKEIVGGFSSI